MDKSRGGAGFPAICEWKQEAGTAVDTAGGLVVFPGSVAVLGNKTNRVSPPLPARHSAYVLRDELRPISPPRTAKCGRVRLVAAVTVACRTCGNTRRASFRGLLSCGSVWACPSCSRSIRVERSGEVEAVNGWHRENGGDALMLSLTVRHALGDDLKTIRGGVSKAWRQVQSGAPWKRWAEKVGLVGSVRALEVTHGANGWHPHLHVLLLVKGGLSDEKIEELRGAVAARWCAAVARVIGESARPDAHGCDLRRAQSAKYLAKLGLELTAPAGKEGRADGSRSPWTIAGDYVRDGSTRDAALWKEWCAGMRGARFLTWSRGLRAAAGLNVERSDEEIAADEAASEIVGVIAADVWDARAPARGWALAVLLSVESENWSEFLRLTAPAVPAPQKLALAAPA